MEIKITNEKEIPFLERKLIEAQMSFEKETPNRIDVKKAIATQTKSKEELIVIRKIRTNFGKTSAIIKAYIYNNEESKNKIETKQFLKRNEEKKVAEGEQ